jgi:drug/metabolite transporter (DMT)-like permease
MILSALLFGTMAFLAKHATRRLGGAQVAFVRFAVGTIVALVQARVRVSPLMPKRRDLLLLRGFLGGMAVLLYFQAIAHIPVGTATLLNYTSPVWTSLFAAWFLGELLARRTIGALAIAIVGVVLVVIGQGQVFGGRVVWQLLGVASAILSGGAVTTIRAARRHDGAWEIFAAFCLVGMACTAPMAIAEWRAPNTTEWALLLGVGGVAVAAQVLMTDAYGALPAASGGIIQQLTVATAFMLGWAFDREPLTKLAAFGALLVLTGVTMAARVRRSTMVPHDDAVEAVSAATLRSEDAMPSRRR